MPRRIAFINEKGGSGKTTLVANMAAHLALRRGRRVLAIDLDPQGQLARALGVEVPRGAPNAVELVVDAVLGDAALDPAHPRGTVRRIATRIPGLDLVPGNKALGLQASFEGEDPTGQLGRALDDALDLAGYDFVFFDAPPSFGPLTLSVLRAAREVVVPVPLTWLALDGCAQLLRTLETVRTRYRHPGLRLSMVVATFHRRTRMASELLEMLKARFPKELAHTILGTCVRIDEAQSHGLSLAEFAPSDRATRAFAALAEELEARAPESVEPLP